MSKILSFLRGLETDYCGRTHADILALSDAELEDSHDFIQWLFPLKEPSLAVPSSPVITEAEMNEARKNSTIQENLRSSLARMTQFYYRNNFWLVRHNHNHLRISRIIRSTRLLLSDEDALRFYAFIVKRIRNSSKTISKESLAHWKNAIEETSP